MRVLIVEIRRCTYSIVLLKSTRNFGRGRKVVRKSNFAFHGINLQWMGKSILLLPNVSFNNIFVICIRFGNVNIDVNLNCTLYLFIYFSFCGSVKPGKRLYVFFETLAYFICHVFHLGTLENQIYKNNQINGWTENSGVLLAYHIFECSKLCSVSCGVCSCHYFHESLLGFLSAISRSLLCGDVSGSFTGKP